MTDQELKLVDEAYDLYDAQLISLGEYDLAQEVLLSSLKTYDVPSFICKEKYMNREGFKVGYLFVYLMRADASEFLEEFRIYMDHVYSEFVGVAFHALRRKGLESPHLLEAACAIVLEQGRSDNCYVYCRSLFKQFERYASSYVFGPNAMKLKQKAIGVQFGRG